MATGFITRQFDLRVNNTSVLPLSTITVVRNDPEECTLRLLHDERPGRVIVDLTLRRGARFIAGYAQRHAAATFRLQRGVAEAATAVPGGIHRTNADEFGNRWVMGSARTFQADLANGSISKGSTRVFDFMIGLELRAANAQAGDRAVDLIAQYIGTPLETVRTVRR
jgi:hypothetical protein